MKSFHFAAEAQKLWVRGYDSTKVLTEPNDVISGNRYNEQANREVDTEVFAG